VAWAVVTDLARPATYPEILSIVDGMAKSPTVARNVANSSLVHDFFDLDLSFFGQAEDFLPPVNFWLYL